jgi:hypothetical protein
VEDLNDESWKTGNGEESKTYSTASDLEGGLGEGEVVAGNFPAFCVAVTAALSSDWSRKRAVRGTEVVITSFAYLVLASCFQFHSYY